MKSCPTCGRAIDEPGPARRTESIMAVFSAWRDRHPRAYPKPVSTMKEWRKIAERLAEGYSVDDLVEAIAGMHRSPHHLGLNDRGTKYLSLELCMRDASHVQGFIEMTPMPVMTRANSVTSQALERRRGERRKLDQGPQQRQIGEGEA